MRERLLVWLAGVIIRRPRTILIAALVAAAVGTLLATNIQVSTSRNQMMPPGHPDQKQFAQFLSEFGTPNQLAIVIEGADAPARRRAAEQLAGKLGQDKEHVREVYYKVDLRYFRDHALMYLPVEELRRGPALIESPRFDIAGLTKVNGLVPLVKTLDGQVASATASTTGAGPGAAEGLAMISRFLFTLEQAMKAPPAEPLKPLEQIFAQRVKRETELIDEEGYLSSRDHHALVVFVLPAKESDDNSFILPFVDAARAAAREVIAGGPQACSSEGAMEAGKACSETVTCGGGTVCDFSRTDSWARWKGALFGRSRASCTCGLAIAVTGLPGMNADENRAISDGILLTSTIAFIGVLILYVFVFRLGRQSLILMLGLTAGVAWTGGFIGVAIGHLTLLSGFFIPIVLGLGDDFGVHFISRYNEERAGGHDPETAVRHTMRDAGPSILTGGVTVALAFFSIGVSKFGAFAETGVIAGVGLLLELLCALTVLPAMVLVFGGKKLPRAVRVAEERARERRESGKPPHVGPVARLVGGRPAAVLVFGVAATAALAWLGSGLRMDYDITRMMPSHTESITGSHKLQDSFGFTAEFGAVVASSLEDAARMKAALAQKETVLRTESLGDFVPPDQEEKLKILASVRPTVAGIRIPSELAPCPPGELAAALDKFGDRIDDAYFLAKGAGAREAPALELLAKRIHDVHDAITSLPPDVAAKKLRDYQAQLFLEVREGLEMVRRWLDAGPVTAEALPSAVRDRFVSHPGPDGSRRYAVYAYARHSIWDRSSIRALIADLREVSPTATGFPVTFCAYSDQIISGFKLAGLLAFGIILITLLADFRSARWAALALGPLLVGGIWMCGLMRLLGVPINLGNLVAFPLVVGLGVDNGVHMLHRFREEGFHDASLVIQTTGRAILLAGMTTILGFGTLVLAGHRGVAAFGSIIILGIGSCMLTATVLLPALLTVIARRRSRPRPEAPPESAEAKTAAE
jgi:uncharacterized protein